MATLKAPATKPFLQKLYTMLEDESAAAIMSWTPNGDAIVVHQPEAFAQQLLPLYFKHNNFSSFVRQLNTYGFNKVDPDAWVFGHPDFKRGLKDQLHLIQRKSSHKTAAAKAAGELAPFSPLAPINAGADEGGTEHEVALQHELALSRAEHASIASRCGGPSAPARRQLGPPAVHSQPRPDLLLPWRGPNTTACALAARPPLPL